MSSVLLSIFLVLASTVAISDEHSSSFMLDEKKGYLKYEEPKKGSANARIWINNDIIIMDVSTPAWNIHGVDAAPGARNEREMEQVEIATGRFLSNPKKYFLFTPSGTCDLRALRYKTVKSEERQRQAEEHVTAWYHTDLDAEFLFGCKEALPERLTVDLFSAFPRLKELHVQVILFGGDLRRVKMTPDKPVLDITRSSN